MEFLKSLFDSGALTWDAFQQAAKGAGFEVVNAAGGAYVPKADADNLNARKTTARFRKERAVDLFSAIYRKEN